MTIATASPRFRPRSLGALPARRGAETPPPVSPGPAAVHPGVELRSCSRQPSARKIPRDGSHRRGSLREWVQKVEAAWPQTPTASSTISLSCATLKAWPWCYRAGGRRDLASSIRRRSLGWAVTSHTSLNSGTTSSPKGATSESITCGSLPGDEPLDGQHQGPRSRAISQRDEVRLGSRPAHRCD